MISHLRFAIMTVAAAGACWPTSSAYAIAKPGPGPTLSAAHAEAWTDADGFLAAVSRAIRFEIAASDLAEARASSAALRDFAASVAAEHLRAHEELRQLAPAWLVPMEVSNVQRALLAILAAQHGIAFDRQYAIDVAVNAHLEAVALHEQYAKHGRDPRLKSFAERRLAALRANLLMARAIELEVRAELKSHD